MAPLSQLQDYMEATTTIMTPQHCNSEFSKFANENTNERFSLTSAWQAAMEEEMKENPEADLPFAFSTARGLNYEQDDDDSQSCDWSVASSDTSVSWDDQYEDDADDERCKELDDYLDLCMKKQMEERPRLVTFCDTTDVQTFVQAAPEYHKDMYYTCHELQRMIDDFVAEGGTKLLG